MATNKFIYLKLPQTPEVIVIYISHNKKYIPATK